MCAINRLDLVTLKIFVAAVEEGTFSRAAERENIAVSAVSRRISDLEMRFGVTLFERHDRGIMLTAAGRSILPRVQDALNTLEIMVQDLEEYRGGKLGFIRIHAHMSVTCTILPKIISEFLEIHPNIDVELTELTSAEITNHIRLGRADIGLVSATCKDEGLHFMKWREDRLVVIMSPGHELENCQSLQFMQLIDYPMIGMQRDSALAQLFSNQPIAAQKSLAPRAYASSFESVRRMVASGLGLAIVPAMSAYPFSEQEGFVVKSLDDPWSRRPTAICMRNPKHMPAASVRFVEHLMRYQKSDADAVIPMARPAFQLHSGLLSASA